MQHQDSRAAIFSTYILYLFNFLRTIKLFLNIRNQDERICMKY